jgi:acyl carrier protein
VNTFDDFLLLVRDELGLPVESGHGDVRLDEVPGWDSVHLLSLLTALERELGQTVSLPDVLTATSFRDIYKVAVRA